MGDLLGGTTGQILSKNSNTNMDFTWITNDVGDITAVTAGTGISGGGTSGAVTITNSMATEIAAKGDLIVGTGSATFDNLAAGANGETLVADSSTSTGLRYTAGNPIPNPTLNSCFDVWQRGTSFTPANSTYTADRWAYFGQNSTNFTIERVATSDTTNLPFVQYAARVKRASGATSTNQQYLIQSFESANSIPFAGRTVTYSFYARAGANYSAASNALFAYIATGTGTDQNALSGYTGSATPISTTVTLTTTWQRFTVTGTLAATTTELATAFIYTPSGTAGANDFFEVTGVQIDIGSVALPIRRNGATIQGELAACQRYFEAQTDSSGGIDGNQSLGTFITTTTALGIVYYTPKRKSPSTTLAAGNLEAATPGGILSMSSIIFGNYGGPTTTSQSIVGTVSSTTSGTGCLIRSGSSAYSIWIDAEL
jgi:hypothetical protein